MRTVTPAQQGAAWWRYVEQVKAWNAAHPEEARENNRKRVARWRAVNPELARECNRRNAAAHRARKRAESVSMVVPSRSKSKEAGTTVLTARTGTSVLTDQSFNITEGMQNGR